MFTSAYPLGTRRCCNVESTLLTLIYRRNNVVCPVGTGCCYVDNSLFIEEVLFSPIPHSNVHSLHIYNVNSLNADSASGVTICYYVCHRVRLEPYVLALIYQDLTRILILRLSYLPLISVRKVGNYFNFSNANEIKLR